MLLLFITITAPAWAQTGTIEGTVTDKKTSESLVGVTILIEGTTTGTITDFDGNYTLPNVKPGTYNIKISYISYEPQVIQNINVEQGKATRLNAQLSESTVNLDGVTVTAVRRTGSEMALLSTIKDVQIVVSGISSQQIMKSQDKDASEVVRRVPGITIVDDRFIVVRGLSQRYNNVWLNNSATPSSESDIKAFSFDVIPSSMLDNILVYKSPAPEIPADFAGGFVKIFTKNLPEANSYTINYSTSYAAGTTFNNFYNFPKSSMAILGYNTSNRSLPSYFPGNLGSATTSDQVLLSKSLNQDWTAKQSTALPDQKLSFGMTHKLKLGKTTLGEITSVNYSNTKDYTEMENRNFGVYQFDQNQPGLDFDFSDRIYKQSVRVSVMNNWSWLVRTNHKIELHNLWNHDGREHTAFRTGREYYSNNLIQSIENGYLSRTTYSGQLSGSHSWNEGNTKLDWITGYALANRSEPDLKRAKQVMIETSSSPNYGKWILSIPNSPLSSNAGRLYMDMNEHIINAGANFEHHFILGTIQPQFKAGFYAEDKNRNFSARKLGYVYSDPNQRNSAIEYLSVAEALSYDNMNSTTGIKLGEETNKSDSYQASNRLFAGYLALNIPIGKIGSIYAGVRAENNLQSLDSYNRFQQPIVIKNDTLNFYPSINLTINLSEKSQIRLGYGTSVNRPEFREIAPFPFFDFENNAVFSGNPDLKNAYITNYDIRYEFYPSQGETFSVGAFYKAFTNPIEIKYAQTGSGLEYTYQNATKADNYGIEMEFRKSLYNIDALKNFSVVVNGSLIKSNINFENSVTDLSRPMAGQSPYVLNAGIYYNETEKYNLMVSLLYNVIGKRIHIVGLPMSQSWETIPDVYEMPRNLLDLTVTKKIGNNLEIKAGIKDLLNNPIVYQQNINTDVDMSYYNGGEPNIIHVNATQILRKYKPGSYYTLGIQYKF